VQEGGGGLFAGDLLELVRILGPAAADGLVDVPYQSLVHDHPLAEFQVRNGIAAQVWHEIRDDDQGFSLELLVSIR